VLKVDDMHTTTLTKDETLHLWIPAGRAVAEVHACGEQLPH
jgi:hypothetical protein